MKNKEAKRQILRRDLVKYSKQIGIIDCEIPLLVFYGEEFNVKAREAEIKHSITQETKRSFRGGRYTTMWGLSSYFARVILVNIRGRNKTIRELRHTLIHELIHYRFRYMSHGDFDKRIKLILAGKEYPRKHITCPDLPYI